MSDTTEPNRLEPLENDEWYDMHVVPKINEIEYSDTNMYFINVMLCWDRHKFRDAYEGRLTLAVFPRAVMVPQKWQPNFAHAVRFIETLKEKLKSFGQEYARVDFRVYHSGAHGPRQALQHAFEDNTPRKGLPFVEVPFTWRYIPMQWNMQTRTYEEDPTIYSLPERD